MMIQFCIFVSENVFSHSEIELLKEYRDKQTDHRLKKLLDQKFSIFK